MKNSNPKQPTLFLISSKGQVMNLKTMRVYKPTSKGNVNVTIEGKRVSITEQQLKNFSKTKISTVVFDCAISLTKAIEVAELTVKNNLSHRGVLGVGLDSLVNGNITLCLPANWASKTGFIAVGDKCVNANTLKVTPLTKSKQKIVDRYKVITPVFPLTVRAIRDKVEFIDYAEPIFPIVKLKNGRRVYNVAPGTNLCFNTKMEYVGTYDVGQSGLVDFEGIATKAEIDEARKALRLAIKEKRQVAPITNLSNDK